MIQYTIKRYLFIHPLSERTKKASRSSNSESRVFFCGSITIGFIVVPSAKMVQTPVFVDKTRHLLFDRVNRVASGSIAQDFYSFLILQTREFVFLVAFFLNGNFTNLVHGHKNSFNFSEIFFRHSLKTQRTILLKIELFSQILSE